MNLTKRRLFLFLASALCVLTFGAQISRANDVVKPDVQLFAYDKSQPLDAKVTEDKHTSYFTSYKVNFASTNNQRIPAILVIPTKPATGKMPAVVLMHGLGMDKTGMEFLWGAFAKAGYALFSIDAQFHGERAPKPPADKELKDGLFGSKMDKTRELILQTVVDLRRSVDYLQSRSDIDPGRIGYAGFSMGGILGSMAAAVDDRFQAPILALAGGDWKVMAKESTHGNAESARKATAGAPPNFTLLEPLDPVIWVSKIAPRPILFINGDADTVVPVNAGKALHAAAGPEKEIWYYKGGHVPAGTEALKTINKMTMWLDGHLKVK